MPVGIICNAAAIAIGGILGALVGHKLSEELKTKIQMIFGACSMAMGISTIVLMRNMPAVIFSVILGTALGVLIHSYINSSNSISWRRGIEFSPIKGISGFNFLEISKALRNRRAISNPLF